MQLQEIKVKTTAGKSHQDKQPAECLTFADVNPQQKNNQKGSTLIMDNVATLAVNDAANITYRNAILWIITMFVATVMAYMALSFNRHDAISTSTVVPAVEVMQWSSDTCWIKGW